jgi:hypothetical protein
VEEETADWNSEQREERFVRVLAERNRDWIVGE